MTLWSGLRLGSLTRGWSRHPTDAALVGLLVPGSDVPTAADAAIRTHLSQCAPCADRSEKLQRFLDGLSETAQTDVEKNVSAERLATQRDRIVRRLRRSVEPGRPARVLRFPSITRPALARVRASRWLTAAAVAGLVVGVAAGQFLHLHAPTELADTVLADTVPSQDAVAASSGPSLASSGLGGELLFALEDDAFLDEIDLMLVAPRIPELDPLDEITPRIREVAVSPW